MSDETCKCGELVLGRHHVRYTHARYHTRGACASTTEPSESAEAYWEQQATLVRITREERDAECRARLAAEAEAERLRSAIESLLTKPATVEGLDPEATRLVEGALRQMQDYLRAALSSPGDGQ